MVTVTLSPSPLHTKKWRVVSPWYTVDFGGRGYSDYTIHKDPARRLRYIQRHKKTEDWSDPTTAGFWSRWLLWEKPSLRSAITFVSKKLKVQLRRVR